MHTTILGCGYSGLHIARELAPDGPVVGTRRDETALAALANAGIDGIVFDAEGGAGGGGAGGADGGRDVGGRRSGGERASGGAVPAALRHALERTTHLISSVAPARALPLADPVLDAIRPFVESGALPALEWIGYLSTIGVYGDHGGAWIDEDTPCTSRQPRSIARREAEIAWRSLGARAGVPVAVLRLSGIYGPGRNAVRDALAGRARMLIKPGQVFNRLHVADLARATALAARTRHDGILNVTDDEPAAPEDVVRHAHALVGRPPPPAVPFDEADVSPMARSFYAESKRVANARSKAALGLGYRYPDYRVGLASLLDDGSTPRR